MTPTHDFRADLFTREGTHVHGSEAVTETEAVKLADQMMRNREPADFYTIVSTVAGEEGILVPLHDSRRDT